MRKPKTWLLAGAALALTAGAITTTALAQTGEAARRQAAQDTVATAAPGARTDRKERREVRVYRQGDDDGARRRGREGYFADILQLRPDQSPALKTFLEAQRDGDREDRMVRFDRDSDRTTLERLDDMQARLTAQQAETSRRITATRTFYAQLDPAQKKAFDSLPLLMVSGPSLGPALIPVGHPMPPRPPKPPAPPRL